MSTLHDGARHGGALKLHRIAAFGEVSNPPVSAETARDTGCCPDGTALAIDSYVLGGAALFASSTGRGGARNRADRESEALSAAQIANLVAAAHHAAAIGLPFTRMITIHWEAAGVPLAGMAKATGRFTDVMAKALARHGGGAAWLWVHEGGADKGGHCHLLAHVRPDLAPVISALQRGWLGRITGRSYQAGVIKSRPIGGLVGVEAGNPELHASNLAVALAYVLKGAGAEAASRFGLVRLEPGGRVIGKRCGTSQNIGAKARNSAALAGRAAQSA
jgi:hypothetical protein